LHQSYTTPNTSQIDDTTNFSLISLDLQVAIRKIFIERGALYLIIANIFAMLIIGGTKELVVLFVIK